MRGLNKVIIIGRLGGDPIENLTANGVSIVHFSVATTEFFTDRNGNKQQQTEWNRITAYGKTAQHIKKILAKGDSVQIEGKLRSHRYTDRKGSEHFAMVVEAEKFDLIEKNKKAVEIGTDGYIPKSSSVDYDIPF